MADLTDQIERYDSLESRLGIRFEALSATLSDGDLAVAGEIHSATGETIGRDLEVVVAVYDAQGFVVGRASADVDGGRFFAFEPFRMVAEYLPTPISKVVLYAHST